LRFRTALAASIAILVAAILVATVAGVAIVLQRAARRDVTEALARSRDVFEELRKLRASLHRSQARVVAEEPRLKAVVATEEVTHETVLSVASELKRALSSDVFVMTDAEGQLIADAADPTATGFSLRGKPGVASALSDGDASTVWTQGDRAYEIAARRLSFGTTTVGVVVIGYAFDDSVMAEALRQTGSGFALEFDGHVIAASALDPDARPDRAAAAEAARQVPSGAEPTEVVVGGVRYLASSTPLADAGDNHLRYVTFRSLDRALAPARQAERVVYAIAVVALILALAITVALSRRLSRPLDALVRFLDHVAAGELGARVAVAGPREVRVVGAAMNRMVGELERSRVELAAKERLERELEISAKIQTGVLPRHVEVAGLEVSAAMLPATDVGGDYYDIFPVEGGAWIGIGDVAGHGLSSGLIMLMVQSLIASLGRQDPDASPSRLLTVLNEVLYDNIRHRMSSDDHVTLTVLRFDAASGRLVFSGAHEEMIVYRAATRRCETVPTPGAWVGAMRDIAAGLVDSELTLAPNDILVLYTDGITEAMSATHEQFGLDRMIEVVEGHAEGPLDAMRDAILAAAAAFSPIQDDDRSLLILRSTRVKP
jgi:phosphoserine phosphatase RsbU/P